MVRAICSTAFHAITTSCYQLFKSVGTGVQTRTVKVLDCVMPRNPVTQHRELRFIPTWAENALGTVYYNDVCPPSRIVKTDSEIKNVFDRLVAQSVRNKELEFEIRVMKDDNVVNAFCLPGGKIVITTGMLNKLNEQTFVETDALDEKDKMKSISFEDKLASVLGHEIAHAAAGHGRRGLQFKLTSFLVIKAASWTVGRVLKQFEDNAVNQEKDRRAKENLPSMSLHEEHMVRQKYQTRNYLFQSLFDLISKVGRFFSILSHGRCNELEADKYGMKISAKAGFNPMASVWLQHKFLEMKGEKEKEEKQKSLFMRVFSKTIDLLSSHPPSRERLQANRKIVQEIEDNGHEAIYPKL